MSGRGATHGASFGLDADLAKKAAAKYDNVLEGQLARWMGAVTGMQQGGKKFNDYIADGMVLCELMNKLSPGSVRGHKHSGMAFVQMENINKALDAIRAYGVADCEIAVTVDIYEWKQPASVQRMLLALGRQAQKRGYSGPKLDVKGSGPEQVFVSPYGAGTSSSTTTTTTTSSPSSRAVPAAAPAAASAAPKFCSSCGAARTAGANFCAGCGGKF